MEELKNQYGEYYWEYGKSPFVQDDSENLQNLENVENNVNVNLNRDRECSGVRNEEESNVCEKNENEGEVEEGRVGVFSNRCAVQGCKMKAMQLTVYCNMHILRDEKQMLYKGCGYVIKRFVFWLDLSFMSFGGLSNCVCVCLFDVLNLLCCVRNVEMWNLGFYYRALV